ncbi:MAG: ATP-binding protein [Cyanobacteria bacterium P01_F01_bin.53]
METTRTEPIRTEPTNAETKSETSKTLLIIDDSKADRTIYRRYLQQDTQQNYALSEVSCAEDGLALFDQQTFDVVLLDFQLPDMNGLDVLSLIQKQDPIAAVIMLTGHGDEKIAVSALKGGAQDYLVKDRLKKDTLQRTVRNVLSKQQLQQRLQKTEEQQQLIAQMAFQIRHSLELEKTLETAVDKVRHLLQCDRVLAYQFADDMSGQIIAESVGTGWTETLGKTVEDTFFQTEGTADYCQGRKQVVADIYHGGLNKCHVELLEQFEVKAILVVPVLMSSERLGTQHLEPGQLGGQLGIDPLALAPLGPLEPEQSGAEQAQDNRLWGLIVAHQCSAVRAWQTDEIRMLETLSIHCAIAIQHAELLAATQAALEKEKSLNTFKSQIIATVSHEYNSPLTAIQAAADLLQGHANNLDASTRTNLLDIISRKSKHMSTLVNDMLVVHRSELDEIELKPTSIDLEAFLTKLITEQQITAEQHRLLLKTRGDIDGFIGDLGLMQQIFSNLLSNAIKYSPDGGDVKVYLIGDDKQIVCSIKDQGIGISEQDQAQLFQPFSRGSNVGAITGTGLGLKIVKTAVDLHDGTIELRSQEGKGTQIKVCLPKQLTH